MLNLYVSNNNLDLILKKQTCLTLFMSEQLDVCYIANIIELVSCNKVAVVVDSTSILLGKLFYIKNLEVVVQIENIIFKAILNLSNDQTKALIEIKEKITQCEWPLTPIFMT